MKEKRFNGKAIYQPSGKAAEYSKWACNFYVGCSNNCSYCYLKKGIGAAILGGNVPTLKKCFRDKQHALEVFTKELRVNLTELQKHGMFFSFTTDPMLPETIELTIDAIIVCIFSNVPFKILTKRADWVEPLLEYGVSFKVPEGFNVYNIGEQNIMAVGFTLTGHDELEPGASTNTERIEAMRKLHDAGIKTFASIEPVIDFDSSMAMIEQTIGICDLYKVGLESGKSYNKSQQESFLFKLITLTTKNDLRVYLKDSILKDVRYYRENLPNEFVSRGYNLFNPETK